MLDIEQIEAPSQDGLDIVSLAEMKQHLRISASTTLHDDDLTECILDAAAKLHGREGELNRSIFPCVWRRYLHRFPVTNCRDWRRISLPFPPLIEIVSVSYADVDESSPAPEVDPLSYIVRTVNLIPEVYLIGTVTTWPTVVNHPRAVSITYRAGYTEYPRSLKRMVKMLAGHYFENREATINEARQMVINRGVGFAMEDFRAQFRITPAYDNWR